jgi:RNA-directed DNA polymerase
MSSATDAGTNPSGEMLATEISYRMFFVRKGRSGFRLISSPNEKLQALQRRVLRDILYKVPVDVCAKAYIPRRGIREAARMHVGQQQIAKFDISDFFPSITEHMICESLERVGLQRIMATTIAAVCCFAGSLPQGAPTSGYLSNIVLKGFDRRFYRFCKLRNLRYTRYSDDITISGDWIDLNAVRRFLEKLLGRQGLRLHKGKTKRFTTKHRQIVTGVVVNHKLSPGRSYLRELRKESTGSD